MMCTRHLSTWVTTAATRRRLIGQVSSRLCHYHQHAPNTPARLVGVTKNINHRPRPAAPSHSHRLYHSYEYDAPPPFSPTETAILSAALEHVPAHGFTNAALTAGARSAGYLDISTNLFPQGPFALINYHLVTQRLALAQHSPLPAAHNNNNNNAEPSTPHPSAIASNIRSLALHRLHANKPILPHWPSALALLATPTHLPTSLKELAALADEILFLAGSTTVTTAWYTDRAGLAAVYASAELFMTTDRSEGFVETEAFLMRRLEEGEALRRNVGMVGRWVGVQVGGLVDGLRSKGVRI